MANANDTVVVVMIQLIRQDVFHDDLIGGFSFIDESKGTAIRLSFPFDPSLF